MKDRKYPKVSVIISTYDRAYLLKRALKSLLAQSFDDFEVIVVDDGSPHPDEYQRVFDEYVPLFDGRGINVWPFRIADNSGYQCYPKNRGIERASGDYIAYLDDDNEWRPNHLQVCVDAIESDFSHDMVYTRLHYIVDDEIARDRLAKQFEKVPEGDAAGTPWNPQQFVKGNYIDTSTILHSKGAFWRLVRESGYGWDEKLRRFGDWNFVWRWATFGNNAKLVDEVTVDYHWHAGSLQVTRPAIETPMTFNYAQYITVKKATDETIGYTRATKVH